MTAPNVANTVAHPVATGPEPAGGPRTLPAVAFVCAYVVLLLGIPSVLILGPLGSPGTPANILGIGALLWWVLAVVGGQNRVRGVTTYRVAVAAFVAVILLCYAMAMSSGWYAPPHVRAGINDYTLMVPSVHELADVQISAADRGLIAVTAWAGITLLVAEGLRSWRDLELVVSWLSWLGAFMAVLGLVQYVTGMSITGLYAIPGLTANSDFGAVASRSVLNRVSATATHAIEYGVVLAAILPLALHRTIHRWGRRGALLPTALIGVGTSLSVSRSAVLSLGIGLLVMLLGWPNAYRRRALVLLPFCVAGMRAVFPGLLGTIYALFANLDADPSISGRTQDYDAVAFLWHDNPWLGRGFFTMIPQFYRILDNTYLLFLVEVGVIGLACLMALQLTSLLSARAVKSRAASPRARHLGLSLSASLTGLFVALGTFDGLGFAMAAGTTFLLMGMAAAAWRLTQQDGAQGRNGERVDGAR